MDHQPNIFWTPSSQLLDESYMTQFINFVNKATSQDFQSYWDLHRWSIDEIGQFWSLVSQFTDIVWKQDPKETFVGNGSSIRGCRWFVDGKLNFAENLLTKAPKEACLVSVAEGREDLVLDKADLEASVAKVANFLREKGVGKGDRVAGILPNTELAVIGMLATSSIGAVWASCSPDFGVQGIVDRFGQIEPKVVFSVAAYQYGGKFISCSEVLKQALAKLPSVEQVVMANHLKTKISEEGFNNLQWFEDLIGQKGTYRLEFEPMSFNDPLYIMFSSGTTGVPKCIIHGVGGTLIQHKKELQLHSNLGEGARLLYFTTCGWMMWNWMVSALSVGTSLVLFEGNPGYPAISRLWEVVDEYKVSAFGTSPKFLAATQKQGYNPNEDLQLSSLATLLSTGAPLLPEQFDWIRDQVSDRVHIASISGGTDIISCFMLGVPILPVRRGEIQAPGLGMSVECWVDGQARKKQKGELVCTKPFPSMPLGFWNDDSGERYRKAYFDFYSESEVWRHGDYISIGDEGGITVFGRSDATLNPGGVRIGTAEIYRVVENFEFVMDSLAVGAKFDGDTKVILFVTTIGDLTNERIDEIKFALKSQLTPRHVPSMIFKVNEIPYTRSGKKLEIAATNALHGEQIPNMTAISNPEALTEFSKIGASLFS